MGGVCTCRKKNIIRTEYGPIKLPFTSEDLKIIKNTWGAVKMNWEAICLIAFERWFKLYPELRYVFTNFPKPHKLSIKDLLRSPNLKKHVKKLEQALELLITKFNNASDLVETIIELGRQHYHYNAEQKYANSLAKSLIYAVTMVVQCSSDVENAWDSLLLFIMDCLKFGIRLEEHQVKGDINENSLKASHSNNETELSVVANGNSKTGCLF